MLERRRIAHESLSLWYGCSAPLLTRNVLRSFAGKGERHTPRPVLILDTSGINRLAADSESTNLLTAVRASFFVRVTESSLSEIVATRDPALRKQLLECLRRLCSEGDCIIPYQWIIVRLIRSFRDQPSSFDWRKVPVRFPECEAEIVRQEIINEELAARQRQRAQILSHGFEAIYTRIHVDLEPLLCVPAHQRPTIQEFVATSRRSGGSMWTLGGKVVWARFAQTPCDEDTLRAFYQSCPPFRAFLIAMIVAGYDRCVRDIKREQSFRAGRMDLFMATYLPYCSYFVGDDAKQLRCLRLIATEGDLDVDVRRYSEFRREIMGSQ